MKSIKLSNGAIITKVGVVDIAYVSAPEYSAKGDGSWFIIVKHRVNPFENGDIHISGSEQDIRSDYEKIDRLIMEAPDEMDKG